MRILGIYVHKMDSMIQKNLQEGWFPFGSYPSPEEGCYVQLDSDEEEFRSVLNSKLYSLDGQNEPEINVCCIAGKNGSGKSTLLDILFRIINNVSYKFLMNTQATTVIFAEGLNADLHFEVDGCVGCVRCTSEDTRLYWGVNNGGGCKEIHCNKLGSYKNLSNFFYTISINYSMYAYASTDFMPRDRHISRYSKGVSGKWIEHVFHKNDGYLTPMVLAPFRDRDGNIDMSRERKLANQRLTSLILFYRVKKQQFIPGYEPARVYWRFDDNYLKNAIDKIGKEMGFRPSKINHKIGDFYNRWFAYFTSIELDFSSIQMDGIEHLDKLCLRYLSYKTYKICTTYPEYIRMYDNRKNEQEDTLTEIVNKIASRTDHITVKIHQCIRFMQTMQYRKKQGSLKISDFEKFCNNVVSYEDMMVELPPSFFYVSLEMCKGHKGMKIRSQSNVLPAVFPIMFSLPDTFTLESMSSGERQFLNSISYALYHIKNLESVQDGHHRVHYRHVNLVLDEAELYYHPDYQRRYIQMLLETLGWCGFDSKKIRSINVVVVTHSPFILSDMVSNNVLYLDNGKPRMVGGQTFGANYYDLLYNSFFFEKNAIGEVATRVITEMIKDPEVYRQNKKFLDILGDPLIRGHLLNKLESDV